MKTRWYIGAGLMAVALGVALLGGGDSYTWVIAVAGAFILVHAFAAASWQLQEPISALIVDLTVANAAVLILSSSTRDDTAVQLAMVGGSVLIVLFTAGWRRVAFVVYTAVFTVVTLLVVADWQLYDILGELVGLAFVLGVVMGVVSAIRGKLSELEAARGQTLGVVSHELRNHLAGVIAASALVIEEGERLGTEESMELLVLANRQAVEAGEVIEDLLTISRAERGILDMNLESVDLTSETATVIRRFSIEDKTIPFDSPDGPVWALVDAPRYDQILRNLVTNAVQYGGPNIQVSVLLVGDLVSVVVSDDGEGAHPSDAASIFQPYRRSRHVPAASESSGLGLWVSRTLARGMGGDLTYRHENDQTFFELTVPTSEKQDEPTLNSSVLAA